MDSITFRCKSCSTPLRARADKAGQKVRCTRCKAVVIIPGRKVTETENEARPTAADDAADAGKPGHATVDANEADDQTEPRPVTRRKRPRRRMDGERSAELRNAPGWRKVRLGLILIALSMCSVLLWLVASFFAPDGWAPLRYVVQALPIAGYLLCAFVPLKGPARNLTIANLGVIAVSLALTIVADRMTAWASADQRSLQESLEQVTARREEISKKATARNKENAQPSKVLADLRKKARAGDKQAAKQAAELDKKLTQERQKRAAEDAEARKQADTEVKEALAKMEAAASRPPLSTRVWGWIARLDVLTPFIQIIILSFFIQAIARAFDLRDLAVSCPRVAFLALISLSLLLLSQLVVPSAWFLNPVFFAIYRIALWPLTLASYIWEGILLIETCTAIDNHLRGSTT